MKLSVLGSDSSGNCYILYNNSEALIIEAGVKMTEVKKALDFEISKINGLIITHEHGDHSKYAEQYIANGIDLYASAGTIDALKLKSKMPVNIIAAGNTYHIKNFTILPFNVIHDANEPLGYLIHHKETGNILFLTDTHYSKYKFKNLNQIIVEANYDIEIVNANVIAGKIPAAMINRLRTSHMSIDTTMQLLTDNDLTNVNNILLIHLSKNNSNAIEFKIKVQEATGKKVTIADKGIKINFNINPF